MTSATTQRPTSPLPVPANGDRRTVTPPTRAFTVPELAFMLGVPLLWAILLLFHPLGDDYYLTVKDHVARWVTVHTGMMVFIPLIAAVVFLLLRGVDGVAAKVSRVALVPFAIFYAAAEIVVGIGTGILVDAVNALPASERATGVGMVDDFVESRVNVVFNVIGTTAWLIAMIAAAVALFRGDQGTRSVPMVVLLVLSAPLIAMHPPPFGPVGLALFIGAVLLVLRGRTVAARALPVARPTV